MSELTYDLTDWDPSEEGGSFERYEGKPPKPGYYEAVVADIKDHVAKSGNDCIRVMYILDDDEEGKAEFKGAPLFDYIVLSVKWKVGQFLKSVGVVEDGSKKSGTISYEALKGRRVKLRVKSDSYEGSYSPKPDGTWPLENGGKPVLDLSEDDEPEDDSVDSVDSDAPEGEAEVAAIEDQLADLGWPTIEEVESMKVADLRDLAEDLDIPDGDKKRKAALRDEVVEALEEMLAGDPV